MFSCWLCAQCSDYVQRSSGITARNRNVWLNNAGCHLADAPFVASPLKRAPEKVLDNLPGVAVAVFCPKYKYIGLL